MGLVTPGLALPDVIENDEEVTTIVRASSAIRKPVKLLPMLAVFVLVIAACATDTAVPSTTGSPTTIAADPGSPTTLSGPTTTEADLPAWEQKWNELVAAAQEEGTIVFASSADPRTLDALSNAFEEAFGITVETLVGGRDLAARVVSEHQAGVYNVDVINDGMGTTSTVFGASGVITDGAMGILAPFRDDLVLPEVTDPSNYQKNKLWFMDPEGAYLWAMVNQTSGGLTVNADIVDPSEITSWFDLLDPKYKGQIVSTNPAGFGAALSGGALMISELGEDYFTDLYIGQEVFVGDDSRQLADLIALGGYSIGLFLDEPDVDQLIQDGFNIDQPPPPPELPPSTTHGTAIIGIVDNAPHPNAAIVFVNWLLSKEGQQIWQDLQFEPSVRIDLELLDDYPDWLLRRFPDPDVDYFDGESWEFTQEVRGPVRELVREILGQEE